MNRKTIGRPLFAVLAALTAILLCIAITPAAHATQTTMEADVPVQMQGMDRYIQQDSPNALAFDRQQALEAGYNIEDVELVSAQVREMNRVLQENPDATLDQDTVVSETHWTTMFRAAVRGVNKTVYHWYGVTETWMDNAKAQQYIAALKKGKTVAYFVPTIAGTASRAYLLGLVWDAENAARPGRGIIVYTRPNPGSTVNAVWHHAQ